jgi:ribosomal silencing factor RsfS
VDILLRARGVDVVHIPLGERCKWTEHFIIATAKSPRHIRMLAGAALHAVKSRTRCVPYTGSHTTAFAW